MGLMSSTLLFAFSHESLLDLPWYLMAGAALAILSGRLADNRLYLAVVLSRRPRIAPRWTGRIFHLRVAGRGGWGTDILSPLVDLGSSLRLCFEGAVIGFSPWLTAATGHNWASFAVTIVVALLGFLLADVSAISSSLDTLGAAFVLIVAAGLASLVLSVADP